MADINRHFVRDCTTEVRTEGMHVLQYYRNSLNVARVGLCSGSIVYIYFVETLEEHARSATDIA